MAHRGARRRARIRVGDIVTVGDVSGTVARIRIRATTIINWDRKELVVPNKEFVTGRVLNWTLSDQMNRIVITVGIAYGSDTAEAQRQILAAAEDHPGVLDDPTPTVFFEAFGDNALTFVLRCFLPDLSNRLLVMHELHMAIERNLNAAGVVVAFPQRDVHLDIVGSLPVHLVDGAPKPPATQPPSPTAAAPPAPPAPANASEPADD